MSFVLQRLNLDDMDATALVMRRSFDERLPWLAGLHTPDEDRAFFRDHVFKDCEVWGVRENGVVGFIGFKPGWVDHLFVLPERQGKGFGDRLLRIAMAACPSLQLWTFQKNWASRRFYEKRGFVAGLHTDGRDNEEREPDVLYTWRAHTAET